MRVFPFSVSEYSTVGGIVLYCLRLISPSFSSSRRSFIFLSPANLTYMMSGVTKREAQAIGEQVKRGDGDKMLPFPS